jgi:phosphoribosylanthranilate isomerase
VTPETIKKVLAYVAAIISAVGVIIGAIFTVDSRYVKPEQLKTVETTAADDNKTLKISLMQQITQLHKQVLDNEELRIQLGDSVNASKILAERNKKELEAVARTLESQQRQQLMLKTVPPPPPPPPMYIPFESSEALPPAPTTSPPILVEELKPSTEDLKLKNDTPAAF